MSLLVDFASVAGGLDNIVDSDASPQLGVAIVGANSTNGTWYYTINGGTNWIALGSVSDASARLLAATAHPFRVRRRKFWPAS